jgi:aryl-alcohol dehydrogenase-like predicted oxidoreductase
MATGQFDPSIARSSLEQSLKALQSDYLDILFLHCVHFEEVQDGRLFGWLEDAVRGGQIRHFGLSTDLDNTQRILAEFQGFSVVHLSHNLVEDGLARFIGGGQTAVVTHAPFAGGRFFEGPIESVQQQCSANVARWSEMTGCNLNTVAGWNRLFMRYALESNPAGVVVCGMHSPSHIAENVANALPAPGASPCFMAAAAEIRQAVSLATH